MTLIVAPSAAPAVAAAQGPATIPAMTPAAAPTAAPVAAAAIAPAETPMATADSAEKTNAVEPKKPAHKRVARERAARAPQNFWDFFSGGFNGGRPYGARSYGGHASRSNGPRSFF